MTALQSARNDIHEALRDEIRRLSVAHIVITAEAAFNNWEIRFEQGRWTEAREWWALYEQLRTK